MISQEFNVRRYARMRDDALKSARECARLIQRFAAQADSGHSEAPVHLSMARLILGYHLRLAREWHHDYLRYKARMH